MFSESHFFQRFKNPEMYIKSGVKYCEPMTATEVIGGEDTELLFNNNYCVEEKFDGTRATLHLFSANKILEDYLNTQIDDVRLSLIIDAVLELLGAKAKVSMLKHYDEHPFIPTEFENFIKDRVNSYFRASDPNGVFTLKDGTELRCNEYGVQIFYNHKMTTYLWSIIVLHIKELIDRGGFYPDRTNASNTYARCFSRRVSKKTNWFCENTDSVPQLRDMSFPDELNGTVIDGEIFIPDKPFKDASGTLNCNWEEAVRRQTEKGLLVIHAFDILYYKGIKVENMPLHRRKYYLNEVCNQLGSDFVKFVPYYPANKVPLGSLPKDLAPKLKAERGSFPELYNFYQSNPKGGITNAKVYYQSIVLRGGEGVILKDIKGKYFHKRGREYQKVKKFLTRDVIIMGFTEPTKEYKGKFPNNHWSYWLDSNGNKVSLNIGEENTASDLIENGFTPVTKFFYEEWIGEIRFGVVITPDEESRLPKNKQFNIESMVIDNELVRVLEVGQCSGFDEETRYLFTCNARDFDGKPLVIDEMQIEANQLERIDWVGTVIEIKAQEVFKDTGKLRHPRFMRIREDKSGLQCTYAEHII